MIVVSVATRTGLENALRAARNMDRVKGLNDDLQASADASILGRIDEAWGQIEASLKKAFGLARQELQRLIDDAVQSVELIILGAGQAAADVTERLLRKIQEFTYQFIQNAFGSIPSTMTIGGASLRLKGLSYSQKLSFSGSLKACLTDVFGLTADGEFSVDVSYENAGHSS